MSPLPLSVVDQISAALSVRSLQQEVIASNIANRDAQGYQRIRLRFESLLDRPDAVEIAADPSAEPPPLEQDVLALSENAGRYQTLARSLSRYFSILSAITSSSRG
jgi:flagellar basal body rod protein FlgB